MPNKRCMRSMASVRPCGAFFPQTYPNAISGAKRRTGHLWASDGRCGGGVSYTHAVQKGKRLLEVETPYAKWFDRMAEYGFSGGVDFWTKMSESTGGRPATDHRLTIDMAKELCLFLLVLVDRAFWGCVSPTLPSCSMIKVAAQNQHRKGESNVYTSPR